MKAEQIVSAETDIKRVGKSGQISLGKQRAGQYFREESRKDGSIVLVPVVIVAKSDWSLRDKDKIRQAISWAKKNRPEESDVDAKQLRIPRIPITDSTLMPIGNSTRSRSP